jgi:hypothetical protein
MYQTLTADPRYPMHPVVSTWGCQERRGPKIAGHVCASWPVGAGGANKARRINKTICLGISNSIKHNLLAQARGPKINLDHLPLLCLLGGLPTWMQFALVVPLLLLLLWSAQWDCILPAL